MHYLLQKKDQVKSQKMKSFWKRVSNFRLGEFQDSGLFKEREVTALPQMTTSGKIVN